MSTGLIKQEHVDAMRVVAERGKHYVTEMTNADEIGKQMLIFQGVAELKSLLTDGVVSAIKAAATSGLTFKVDNENYPLPVIRDAVAEALIRGLSLVGNEFNIIAGNFYCTKEGWMKRLRLLGATRVQVTIGDAEDSREKSVGNRGAAKITAYFRAKATCDINGKEETVVRTKGDDIDGRICVTAFGRDIEDAMAGLKGKAEARILRSLWYLVSGEPDGDPDEVLAEIKAQLSVPPVPTQDAALLPMPGVLSEKYHAACALIAKASTEKELFDLIERASKYRSDGVIAEGEFQSIEDRAEFRRRAILAGQKDKEQSV